MRRAPYARRAGPVCRLGAVAVVALALGCPAPRAPLPRPDPAEAARLALEEYDQNRDGLLDPKELARSPALRGALKRIDADGDGKLSAAEIADRLRAYPADWGRIAVPCRVTLDGRPLAGATVTLVPEKFLGPAYRRASGVTDADGAAHPREEGQDEPGVVSGFYRVEVSRKDAQGRETVPARFNSQTVLGQEVAADTLGRGGDLPIPLTSR